MAIVDQNGDPDVLRVWSLLSEVSEQLSQNRSSAVNLHALADGAKAQAIHSQSGFVLRRFNLDKPKEVYDAELERMNAAMSAENQTLLNDNRQLSALIREYEQTLENIMATFRTRAHEVQQRELALMRQYESVIIQRETEALNESLKIHNARSESLARASCMLRAVLRRLGGEDVHVYEAHLTHIQAIPSEGRGGQSSRGASSTLDASATGPNREPDDEQVQAQGSRKDKGKARDDGTQDESEGLEVVVNVDRIIEEEDDPEKRIAVAEWALERESELARLERENEELRALVNGLLQPANPATVTHRTANTASSTAPIPIPEHPNSDGEGQFSDEHPSFSSIPRTQQQRLLGGRPGTVGPFGTYKKSTVIRMDSR